MQKFLDAFEAFQTPLKRLFKGFFKAYQDLFRALRTPLKTISKTSVRAFMGSFRPLKGVLKAFVKTLASKAFGQRLKGIKNLFSTKSRLV